MLVGAWNRLKESLAGPGAPSFLCKVAKSNSAPHMYTIANPRIVKHICLCIYLP